MRSASDGINMTRRKFSILMLAVCTASGVLTSPAVSAQDAGPPELRLSLREALQAATDNNVNVRLLKERIAAAQAQADTSLGAMLPNVGGYLNGRHQTVNLAAFGIPPDRLGGLGLTRNTTDPLVCPGV